MSHKIIKFANIEEKIFNNGSDVTMKSYMTKERTGSIRHLRLCHFELIECILICFKTYKLRESSKKNQIHLFTKGDIGRKTNLPVR